MKRNTTHLDRRAVTLPARGQRNVKQARRLLGILEKQLVEIAHAVEEQGVRVVRLERQVLAHHRGVF